MAMAMAIETGSFAVRRQQLGERWPREEAFVSEVQWREEAKDSRVRLARVASNARQLKQRLADLELKRQCLAYGLVKWRKLSERARRHVDGSEVLAKKYPVRAASIPLRGEGDKLKDFYRKVNARLKLQKADLEAQIVANDERLTQEKANGVTCREDLARERRRYATLRNKVEESQEHQRHCIFASSLWQPTPA